MSPSVDDYASRVALSTSHDRLRRLGRLCKKELKEILRDRRTVITLILMPLLVYPILSVAFQRLLVSSSASISGAPFRYVIAVDSEENAQVLMEYLLLGHHLLTDPDGAFDREAVDENMRVTSGGIQWVMVDDMDRLLAESHIDLAVITDISDQRGPSGLPHTRFNMTRLSGSSNGRDAWDFVQSRLRAVNDVFIEQQLASLGATANPPIEIVEIQTQSSQSSSVSLAALVPLILILMTITGAVYPAIDLTAGERERGTLEALIAAPVPRVHLLLAKYSAVVTVALLTAAANLVAMTVTLYSTGLMESLFGQGLNWQSLFFVFALLVLFAAFFSAVLLAVTSFARSFKEAQAYLIPLMLFSLAPGILALTPGIKLGGILSVCPLVNIVLLARDLFQGTVEAAPAAVAVISTILYAAGAIAIAARIFGADAVLYGSQAGWSEWLQRPEKTKPYPSLTSALLFLAVLFPTYIILANFLTMWSSTDLRLRLGGSGVITIILFGVLPFAVSLLAKIRLADTFCLKGAPPLAFLSAALLGASLWPLAHEVFLLHQSMGMTLAEEHIDAVRSVIDSWQQLPLPFILFILAVIPAVFEELFFRGFLFTALLHALSPFRAIVISAVFFGVFHVVAGTLAPERFLPSTFMGLVLGWVCWKNDSIYPGMLLHAVHNGLLVSMGYYMDWLSAHQLGQEQAIHLPAYWIGCAVVGTIAGIVVMKYVCWPRPADPQMAS